LLPTVLLNIHVPLVRITIKKEWLKCLIANNVALEITVHQDQLLKSNVQKELITTSIGVWKSAERALQVSIVQREHLIQRYVLLVSTQMLEQINAHPARLVITVPIQQPRIIE
jgi:hypothetical protein